MKFKATPKLIIWDAKDDKVLAKFDDHGVFETKNAGLIKKLKALGYTGEGEEIEEDPKQEGKNDEAE